MILPRLTGSDQERYDSPNFSFFLWLAADPKGQATLLTRVYMPLIFHAILADLQHNSKATQGTPHFLLFFFFFRLSSHRLLCDGVELSANLSPTEHKHFLGWVDMQICFFFFQLAYLLPIIFSHVTSEGISFLPFFYFYFFPLGNHVNKSCEFYMCLLQTTY